MGHGPRQQPLEHRLLLTATFCLLAGGAVMVYSASSARTLLEGHGDGTAYLVKYLMYGAVGLVVMQLLAPPRPRARPALHAAAAARRVRAAACSCCCPGFGVQVNGARRWLGAGPAAVPAGGDDEARARPARRGGALGAAEARAQPARRGAARSSCPAACAVLLIAAQPDLGTALVIGFTLAAMLVAAGLPLRQLGLVAGGGRRRWCCSSRCSSPTGARG